MGKKGERGAKERSAAQEEEARNAARKAEHGEEEYQCTGALEQDFPELCARAGLQEAPRVVSRPHPPAAPPPEEPEGGAAAAEQREAPGALAQIQGKYAYFRPTVQVELEHEDPKSAREVFIRSWKIEEKMLGVFAKCLPALAHLQALHLWKVGLTDATFLSLLSVLATCTNLKTLVLEGNPLPQQSFYKLVSEESSLAHLSLRNNNIDNRAALLIGQALSSLHSTNKNLVSINLSYNHIGDAGATHLANGLRLNRSLLSLSLAYNEIGDEGAQKLAEVFGPFALTHAEVVERRRLQLEKEAQERCRLPQRHTDLKSDRPSSHVSSTTIDKLQPLKGGKAVNKKKARHPRTGRAGAESRGLPLSAQGLEPHLSSHRWPLCNPRAERRGTEHPRATETGACLSQEPAKKEEKGQATGAAPAQPPAVAVAAAAQAKKDDAKQSKKAAPPIDPKAARGKGAKLSSKDKRSQILDMEQILEPTEMMNPLLEPAEHRDGQVFLQGNRVIIFLNLIRNHITENGLKAFLAMVEYQVSRVVPGGKGPTGLLHLSLAKNSFPADSKTYSRIQELMAPRDPLPKASKPEEELLSAAQ
ncbi:leucine-rich repeat-containing protein 71 [Candoia aspera]|uniref:leucine-rich repeat-containing protein 71 n=1 Tax=Candoia aspera TaxID=51853 RepID=UPI002FD7FC77